MFKGLRKKASVLALGGGHDEPASDNYPRVLKQVRDFEIALQAMDYLLDDRTSQGTKLLEQEAAKHQQSASEQPAGIFPLALGVMQFIEATLGFEPEVMERALTTLQEAEAASDANHKYNSRHRLATSHIYPPGTEFDVTHAESTLLCALLMLLRENNGMVEGLKALYKLRAAYNKLDSTYKKIKASEPAFNRNLAKLKAQAAGHPQNLSNSDLPGYSVSSSSSSSSLPADVQLMQNLEAVYQMRKGRIEGTNLGNADFWASSSSVASSSVLDPPRSLAQSSDRPRSPAPGNEAFLNPSGAQSSAASNTASSAASVAPSVAPSVPPVGAVDGSDDDFSDAISQVSLHPSDNHLYVSTIDEFIHSGVQLCFGILQVVLSLIPPAIGKVLSIVGFKGDRDTGLRMLWRTAITSRNIHGDLALLCLLVFYDGPVQFVDVGFQLPHQTDDNVTEVISLAGKVSVSDAELGQIMQNPALYTPQLLNKARKLFPHNALWLLQEGRILAAQGKLYEACDMMQRFTDDPSTEIRMQQVEALLIYDRAMLYAFKHDFDQAARDFIRLIDINSWSKAVYLYMAANCYLAKYRMIEMGLAEGSLDEYEKLANKYYELAPTYVPGSANNPGKKGGIGGGKKKMPFDKFLLRKLDQVAARRRANKGLKLVDATGPSVMHELMYFWNGYNRMTPKELEMSLKVLSYTAPGSKYAKCDETEDDHMIRNFLESMAMRSLGQVAEGEKKLDHEVIGKYVTSQDPFRFTKMAESPYLYPTALYERSMFVWLLRTAKPNADVPAAVHESLAWLHKAEQVGEGDYELSNRTGMRIKAAGERLESFLK
ncbi:inclusion body clearance protein Iml2p [Diutina catenulata]